MTWNVNIHAKSARSWILGGWANGHSAPSDQKTSDSTVASSSSHSRKLSTKSFRIWDKVANHFDPKINIHHEFAQNLKINSEFETQTL